MSTDTATADADTTAYEELLSRYERISSLQSAQGVLSWDQQVTMPEGGTPARSKELSTLSSLEHELLTDNETADLLDAAEAAALDDEQAAVVREIRRDYERADAVPQSLVEEISETSTEALGAWEEAEADDDFETFAPYPE